MARPERLVLTAAQRSDLLQHAASTPNEVCGVLVGRDEQVTRVVRCRNVAEDLRAAGPLARSEGSGYVIDPLALLRLFRQLEGSRERVVAYYHSHPATAQLRPSQTDLTDARSALEHRDALFVIVHGGEVRAFAIEDQGDARPVEVTIAP